jgi:hypothetical protein
MRSRTRKVGRPPALGAPALLQCRTMLVPCCAASRERSSAERRPHITTCHRAALLEEPLSGAYEVYDGSSYARGHGGAFEGPPFAVHIANLPLHSDERLVAGLFQRCEVSCRRGGVAADRQSVLGPPVIAARDRSARGAGHPLLIVPRWLPCRSWPSG